MELHAFLITVGLIIIVFVIIVLMSESINTKYKIIEDEAKKIIQSRFNNRSSKSLHEIIENSNLQAVTKANAILLLKRFGSTLKIEPGKFRHDDSLSKILTVGKDEFTNLDESTWQKLGCDNYLQVFTYEIFYLVESISDIQKWNFTWSQMENAPENEDEWIDFILSLNLQQFLGFFSPMI